jgi:photosystem II stability/assembly factor-like uncharacterized protein
MRWNRIIAMVVAVVALVTMSGSKAMADTPGTLAVYTTPDPATTAGSAVYIYSQVALGTAPRVRITGPWTYQTVTATFEKSAGTGQWWDARLPGGAPGIYQVSVTAAASGGVVTGSSSYEVVGGTARGPGWRSSGPSLAGGLLAVDQGDPRSLYVASALAGELFASHDGGASWRMERSLPVAGGYPTALLATGGRQSRLILAINGGNGLYVDDPTYTGKILQSDDGGQHWRDLGMPDSFVDTVLAAPDGRALVAVTYGGIEVTRDEGRSWERVEVPWSSSDYSGAALIGGDLYVATLSGLYVIRDVTGKPAAPALVFAPAKSAWVVAVAGDGDKLYADAFDGGLYESPDAGATWTHVYDPPEYVSMLDDVDGRLFMNGQNSILVSGDGGGDWASWPEPVAGLYERSVAIVGGTVIVATLDGGVFATSDQGARYRWLGGISDLNAYGVAVAGGEIIVGTESGTFRAGLAAAGSGDRAGWGSPFPLPVYNSATPLVVADPAGTIVYKVLDGPRIGTFTVYESLSEGGRGGGWGDWRQLGSTHYGTPGALLVDPADPADLYVTGASGFTGDTLSESGDGGQTWTSVTLPGPVTALAGDPGDPRRLWLGGPGGLWTSADGGRTFTKLQSMPVRALEALGGSRLIVAGSRFYVSDDSGVTIRAARQPDLDMSVSALISVGHVLYAGSTAFHEAGLLKGGHGVLRSTDGGASWALFSSGLTDRDVLSLAADPGGTELFAGTLRGGVFILRLRDA